MHTRWGYRHQHRPMGHRLDLSVGIVVTLLVAPGTHGLVIDSWDSTVNPRISGETLPPGIDSEGPGGGRVWLSGCPTDHDRHRC